MVKITDDFSGFLAFVALLFANDKVALNSKEPMDNPRWLCMKGTEDDLLTGLPELLEGYRQGRNRGSKKAGLKTEE